MTSTGSVFDADVLLITSRRATEVDGVIDQCRMRGLTIERVNLCQYPEREAYSWSPVAELLSAAENCKTVLSSKAAWFHDPGQYTIARSLDGHARELALRDCDGFWGGALLSSNANWLNSPQAVSTSSRKLLQLDRAASLGVPTPETLVSNDPDHVKVFFQSNGGAVVKSIANGYSVYGSEQLKLYSQFYAAPSPELLDGLAFSPMIFQRAVAKRCELRVTVVDEQYFGLNADTADMVGCEIDVRRLDYKAERARFSGVQVPEPVKTGSRDLMRSFDLSYAGLDWVLDDTGEWTFLELNCMGSFKWSELCGAGDITGAISDALARRAGAH